MYLLQFTCCVWVTTHVYFVDLKNVHAICARVYACYAHAAYFVSSPPTLSAVSRQQSAVSSQQSAVAVGVRPSNLLELHMLYAHLMFMSMSMFMCACSTHARLTLYTGVQLAGVP